MRLSLGRVLGLPLLVLTLFTVPAMGESKGQGHSEVPPGEWQAYGRDHSEQRFSPLSQISARTVDKLGVAWSYDMRVGRGVEATPLVVGGVMYVTSAWSIVYALDAKTGRELWVFDPEVDRAIGAKSCCDAVNRGVAYADGMVFVAALDGRLIGIDAKTGKSLWQTQTFDDPEQSRVITGAPRTAKGMVFIGNSGADMGLGLRGYVGAYDARTGALAWRFYTVPGDPSKGPDGAASDTVMALAAQTWTGEWWKFGGGGTVWDSITYDPELDRIYIGVGNGGPWNHQVRSPGGGDNLFLASIIAVDRATGRYLWHYQTTPGETWDTTATQSMILANLKIEGKHRRVLMQAPKNGFFYVIDRDTGKLISAKNIVPMAKAAETPLGRPISWAYGVDLETGRPLENREARFRDGTTAVVHPVGPGAHGWQPMAFSPMTGLAYIPVQDVASTFKTDPDFKPNPRQRISGIVIPNGLPKDPKLRAKLPKLIPTRLVAWDPIRQAEAWRVENDYVGNGGVLVTAGGLVFQGKIGGEFVAHDARTGAKLWSFDGEATAQGGPVSYEVDGEAYIAIAVGNGGSSYLGFAMFTPERPAPPVGRVIVFKLGGKASIAHTGTLPAEVPPPPKVEVTSEGLKTGDRLYHNYCAACHGFTVISGRVLPDLRRSLVIQDAEALRTVVIEGALRGNGMPSFAGQLTPADLEKIRAYIASEADYIRSRQPGGKGSEPIETDRPDAVGG